MARKEFGVGVGSNVELIGVAVSAAIVQPLSAENCQIRIDTNVVVGLVYISQIPFMRYAMLPV